MKTPTILHRSWRVALWAFGLTMVLVLAAFVFIPLRIGTEVRAVSEIAVAYGGGDRVEALLRYAEDNHHTFAERNRAVWALGQLGDSRALAPLRKHYSGEPCDHGGALCQREIGKALKLLDGGVNATAFVWRHSLGK